MCMIANCAQALRYFVVKVYIFLKVNKCSFIKYVRILVTLNCEKVINILARFGCPLFEKSQNFSNLRHVNKNHIFRRKTS